ncbi:MAG: 50S ribosomal protein L11 methyltransferase [Bacteroides sp.]|nr:50S ribosomal protein L11 methyltransferase [Bacillota bacterium]MCM1394478.1 50S ribosomal protein L11 methyltransferase [[Eubacterium] siraeum]MCM1455720.1 50S ribosomal protein L11 methyltransferase [Bacteroides sp.]
MKYKTITVFTNHQDADLVSSAMFDVGAGGVSILDRQDFLDLVKSDVIWDYVDESVLLAGEEVKVSTVTDVADGGFAARLAKRLNEMKEAGGISYGEIIEDEIDAADYENEWKKYYKPIRTANITVVPTWIKYSADEGERVMRLDPGMAFGTGSHATTRMCLDLLDAEGKDVIDVGCGSGILGIAAKLCGAKSVYMCDIDAQATEFAQRNAELNGVNVEVECADLIAGERKADLIFANITADILMRLCDDIGNHLREGGRIVLSGIIDSRLDEVVKRYENAGYAVLKRLAQDDWRALLLAKSEG